MKICNLTNRAVFFAIIFISLAFLACDITLQWPKEIEIRKQMPELVFKADMGPVDLAEIFGNLDFSVGDAAQKKIDCENTNIITKIIYIKIYDNDITKEVPLGAIASIISAGGNVDEDVTLVSTTSPIKINYPVLSSPLNDFSILPLRAKVYLSGENKNNSFLNALAVEVEINSDIIEYRKSQASGLNGVSNYSGESLPPSSNNDLILFEDKNDITIKFKIILKGGNTINTSELTSEIPVLAELAIWVPYVLIADDDASLNLSEFDGAFDGIGDFLGGGSGNEESFIQYLDDFYFSIIFNENPFPDSVIEIKNGIETIAQSRMSGKTFKIPLNKNDIGTSFDPKFKVIFNKGDMLIVPNKFFIDEFAFKATLKLAMELPQIPEGFPWEW